MEHNCVRCQKQFNSQEALEQHRKVAHPHEKPASIKPSYIIIGILLIVAVLSIAWLVSPKGQYDTFAKCIADSGTKFY